MGLRIGIYWHGPTNQVQINEGACNLLKDKRVLMLPGMLSLYLLLMLMHQWRYFQPWSNTLNCGPTLIPTSYLPGHSLWIHIFLLFFALTPYATSNTATTATTLFMLTSLGIVTAITFKGNTLETISSFVWSSQPLTSDKVAMIKIVMGYFRKRCLYLQKFCFNNFNRYNFFFFFNLGTEI